MRAEWNVHLQSWTVASPLHSPQTKSALLQELRTTEVIAVEISGMRRLTSTVENSFFKLRSLRSLPEMSRVPFFVPEL